MGCKVLIFRTDRVGDLLVACPAILTIKNYFIDAEIHLVSSEKNYSYALSLNIFKNIYKFPSSNILNKIKFIQNLRKKEFDYIFVFDGKSRSIITASLINSKYKVALVQKIKFIYKFFNIKLFKDSEETSLDQIFQQSLYFCNINAKIENFNFLSKKKDNNFSSNISIDKYTHIHLDEKWFSNIYIKSYTDINPDYDSFINFIINLTEKQNILITTGIIDFNLLDELKKKFFEKKNEKIYVKKYLNNFIYFIYKPTFEDIESLLRKSKILITCHGAILHAANSFDVKKIDIIEKKKEKFYQRFTFYLNDYKRLYRSDFTKLEKDIYKLI
jgi:ADP-heptose:LPS heptosyltransferase